MIETTLESTIALALVHDHGHYLFQFAYTRLPGLLDSKRSIVRTNKGLRLHSSVFSVK